MRKSPERFCLLTFVLIGVRNESLQAEEALGLQPDVLPRGMAEGGILFSA